jgi:protein-disulfide isomerase
MPIHRLALLALALIAAVATLPVRTAGQQPAAPSGPQPAAPASGQRPAAPSAGQQPAAPGKPPAGPARQPAPPVVIDTQGSPALGPDNAAVTIIEFGDLQCPSCAQGAKALRRLHAIYPDRVRWVYKHYPLRTLHPEAALAHEAAAAAHEQGKFWEMHELIMRNQGKVRYHDLVGYAQEIGLDLAAFKDALDTRRLRPQVIRDMETGRQLRVFATPTYYVNGTRLIGARTTSEFRTLVDAFIRRPATAPAEDTPQPGTDAPPAGGGSSPTGAAPATGRSSSAGTAPSPASGGSLPRGVADGSSAPGSPPAERSTTR